MFEVLKRDGFMLSFFESEVIVFWLQTDRPGTWVTN
jgi:hypothetical protein